MGTTTEKGISLVFIEYQQNGNPKKEKVISPKTPKEKIRPYMSGDKVGKTYGASKTTCENQWMVGGYQNVTTVTTPVVEITKVNSIGGTTKYKVYDSIEKTTETYLEKEGLYVTKNNTIPIQIGEKEGVVLTLHRITFNRQIYKPNEIVADLHFSKEPSAKDLKTLLGKKVKIVRYTEVTDDQKNSSTITYDEWFEGFYIHDLLPLKQSGMDFFVLFHIYSLDHQLTRKKYSRTYVAKKLFADILLEGIDKKGTPPAYTAGTFNYNTIPTKLKNLFVTYYLKRDDNDQYTTFDHLGCTIKDEKDENITTERIQPYLVQYNESFYDFMVRTANRCGEFFFWEDSALRFGRTCTGSGTLPENESLDDSISSSDCQMVYYTAVNAPDKQTVNNGKCDSAMSFDNDYLTLDDFNTLADISNSADNAPDLNFDDDENYANPASSNSKYLYNDEVNHDVYRTRLYKDRFDSLYFEHVGNDNSYGLSFLSRVLNNTSLYDMIKEFGVFEPLSTIASKCKSVYVNNKENDRHLDNDSRPNLNVRKRTENKVEYYSSFMTADTSGHVNADFYHTIRINEEKLTRQLITFNLTTPKRFRLGQKITYDSTDYVIVQIKDNPAINNANKDSFKFIDPTAYNEFSNMGNAIMQVVAIPLADGTVYPPLHPSGHVRRSEPQVAYVADFRDPEKRGRVRITYPWQHKVDTEASPWIRVLTPSATSESGCTFELAVGDEVLVDYESGNVERPYVAGTLYNKGNATPFYRGNMALISKNGHGIAFSDPVDASKFAAGISPSYTFVRQFLPSFPHGSSDALKLAGGVTLSDAYGFYKIEMSTDRRKIDISSPFGKVNIDAFTGINISAPNGDINIKGQNINIEAGNAIKITSGTNIKKKGYFGKWKGDDMKSWKNCFAQVGASFAEGIVDYIKPLVTVVDLDLLRKIIEVFLRPIDGTLEIKSHQYLLLEAGKGEATVRPDRYNKDKLRVSGSVLDTQTYSDNTNILRSMEGYIGAADKIRVIVDTVLERIKQLHDTMETAKSSYQTAYINNVPGLRLWPNEDIIAKDDIVNAVKNSAHPETYDNAKLKVPDRINGDAQFSALIANLKTKADDLSAKAWAYFKAVNELDTTTQSFASNIVSSIVAAYTLHYDKVQNAAASAIGKMKAYAQNNGIDWATISVQQITNLKAFTKKVWFAEVIEGGGDFEIRAALQADVSNWDAFVGGINSKTENKVLSTLKDVVTSPISQYRDFFNSIFRDRDHWDTAQDGQIIYSDQPNKSYYIDATGARRAYTNGSTANLDVSLNALKNILNSW